MTDGESMSICAMQCSEGERVCTTVVVLKERMRGSEDGGEVFGRREKKRPGGGYREERSSVGRGVGEEWVKAVVVVVLVLVLMCLGDDLSRNKSGKREGAKGPASPAIAAIAAIALFLTYRGNGWI